jgi:glutaconate CoA-transferase subunit A
VESGKIQVIPGEEGTLLGGFLARAEGVPYHPVCSLLGTDFLRLDPALKRFTSEDGEEVWMVPAMGPEVSVICAQEADEFGNLRYLGSPFADPILVRASDRVIAMVDRIVPTRRFRAAPDRTTIQGFRVACVVEIAFGAHPCASQGIHIEDEAHLHTYLDAARKERKGISPEAFSNYLQQYVYEPKTHEEYLERIGGPERLAHLSAPYGRRRR